MTGANLNTKRLSWFAIVALITYTVSMLTLPSLPRSLPATPGAVVDMIRPPQPIGSAFLVAEPPRVLTTEEIAARCDRSIAFVSGQRSSGTGFLVQPGVLATNAHVLSLERIEDLRVTFPATALGSMTTELLFEDPPRDLALLAVPTVSSPLEIESNYRFRRGQDVTVIGNPSVGGTLILKNALSRGVMSTEVVIDGRRFYQLNIAINPGNSGGPTIDSSGKVVGVVTLKSSQLEATAFCVPASDLLSAIGQAKSEPRDKEVVLGMHRARYVALFLAGTSEFYSAALSKAVANIGVAVDKDLDPNLAASQVRKELAGPRQKLEEYFAGPFDKEFDRVFTDVRIADSVRSELRSILENCLEMKSSIDAPKGPVRSYLAHVSALQEKHHRHLERLKAGLGF